MDNSSLVLNGSNSIPEFPYWRPTLAIDLFIEVLATCCVIFFHLFLLVVLLKTKKSHFQPLNIVHMSLLLFSTLDNAIRMMIVAAYIPSVYQNCVCSRDINTMFVMVVEFGLVFRPLSFASLGVLQLLIILRKKKFANVKTAFGMITLCIGISLIFVASTFHVMHTRVELLICYHSHCPNSRPESGLGILVPLFIIITLTLFLPSLAVTILTSTWSCVTFKKYYTGGNDQLNRRMLSLPVIMPLAILASTTLQTIVILLVSNSLFALSLGIYSPYWILFFYRLISNIFRIFSGVTYPLILVYTHSDIRYTFKRLLKCGTNRVNPARRT